MAEIRIKSATVVRMLGDKGCTVRETRKDKSGNEISDYYKVWFGNSPAMVSEGDLVDISGLVSTKLETYTDKNTGEDKTVASLHVNFPKIVQAGDEPF